MSGDKLVELEALTVAAHDTLMTLQTRRLKESRDPADLRKAAELARYDVSDEVLEARLVGPVAMGVAYLRGRS